MQIEAMGKSVEIAIQNGLLECGMKREDVDVKVVEEGGLFKKAKVILSWGEQPKQESAQPEQQPEQQVEETISEQFVEEVSQQPANETKEKKHKLVDSSRLEKRGIEFLTGLARLIDDKATVECVAGENELNFSIRGEKVGKLIGYHGENMQAIQMLLSGLKTKGEGAIRMYLDVDGYKQNRNQAIVDLANKIAEQAIKIERNIHMDPMNAYDRRIVHTTLQAREDVTTESTGEGEKRHVVVKPIFKR